MSYVEFLRVRTPLSVMLACWIVAVNAIVIGINYISGAQAGMRWTIAESLQVAGIISLGWASAMGASLWEERNHLAATWTKPQSRTRYALGVFAVNAAVLIGIFVVSTSLAQIAAAWGGILAPSTFGTATILRATQVLLVAFAWFGLMQAMTAPLRSSSGIVLGPAWGIAVPLMVAGSVPLPRSWHDAIVVANAINPLAYGSSMWVWTNPASTAHPLLLEAALPPAIAIAALFAIFVIGAGFAIARWQRVEA